MEALNITKGVWRSCCLQYRPHFLFAGKEGYVTVCGFYQKQEMVEDLSDDEVIANATLIQDAGNTYQKSPILPSQLLEQRDVLLEMLKECFDMCDKLKFPTESELKGMSIKIQSLIKATEL